MSTTHVGPGRRPGRLFSGLALAAVLTIGAAACGDDPKRADAPVDLVDWAGPQRVPVRFDARLYGDGDAATVEVRLDGVTLSGELGSVIVVSTETGDAERLALSPADGADTYRAGPLPIRVGGRATPDDGTLAGGVGESIVALYFVDAEAFGGVDDLEDLSYDVAGLLGDGALPAQDVMAEIALSDDEDALAAAGRPTGTILTEGGLPVQLATRELIAVPRDAAELARILDATGGDVLAGPLATGLEGEDEAYLVSAEPTDDDIARLPSYRALLGEEGTMLASRADALGIYALAARLRLDGLPVAVNARLQFQGAPTHQEQPDATLEYTTDMVPAPNALEGACLPHDATRACWLDVPAAWAHMALFGFDDASVPVAVLDMGFAPNADFRGSVPQCDMTPRGAPVCGPGAAEGAPTVGNSFFGDRSWHGTGVVTAIGGVVNDGFGAAGVGGQVATPRLYKYDLGAYVFDIGGGIRRAVADGAAVVNVSAGFPCRVLTSVGPNLEVCSPSGRAGTCAALGATAGAAAGIACGIFPFVCPALASAVSAATTSCLASLAFGDARDPMAGAIWHATRQGVPVVASAGNALSPESLPPVVRDLADLGNTSSDAWGMVPATLPNVISVGAVDDTGASIEFDGDSVDVWAPTWSSYFAPERVDDPRSPLEQRAIGGTSGAAPFVSGLIAAMQAANPALDPTIATHSEAERRTIVERITRLLVDTGRTDADMVALGFPSQPARRLTVHPLAALEAASADRRADLGALGLLETYGFEELDADDDATERSRALTESSPLLGTLVSLTRSGTSTTTQDVDWISVSAPDDDRHEYLRALVTVESAGDSGGRAFFDHPRLRLVEAGGPLSRTSYEVIFRTPETVRAPLEGFGRAYRLSRTAATPVSPDVAIVAPAPTDTLCAGDTVVLEGTAGFAGHPATLVRESGLEWTVDGLFVGSGFTASFVPSVGEHVIRAQYDASGAGLRVTAEECVGTAPSVAITSPGEAGAIDVDVYAVSSDAAGWYHEITLRASVTDPDEVVPDAQIVWSTSAAGFQPGGPTSGRQDLGTGRVLTTRLYTSCGEGAFGVVDHEIRVAVTDSDGLRTSSPADGRVIRVRLLC